MTIRFLKYLTQMCNVQRHWEFIYFDLWGCASFLVRYMAQEIKQNEIFLEVYLLPIALLGVIFASKCSYG